MDWVRVGWVDWVGQGWGDGVDWCDWTGKRRSGLMWTGEEAGVG